MAVQDHMWVGTCRPSPVRLAKGLHETVSPMVFLSTFLRPWWKQVQAEMYEFIRRALLDNSGSPVYSLPLRGCVKTLEKLNQNYMSPSKAPEIEKTLWERCANSSLTIVHMYMYFRLLFRQGEIHRRMRVAGVDVNMVSFHCGWSWCEQVLF